MKKLLAIGLAMIALWIAVVVVTNRSERSSQSREWPMGLGRLESVPERYLPRSTNASAHELMRLSAAAGIEFDMRKSRTQTADSDTVKEYVRAQLERADRGLDPAPAIVTKRREALEAVRDHLLSAEPPVFDVDIRRVSHAPNPNLLAHMRLSRLLTADALDRARAGDARAWDDLHAQWNLTKGLSHRPEFASAFIALTMTSDLVVAARRMPGPAPSWFDEVRTFDYRRALLAAMQADTWTMAAVMREEVEGDDAGSNSLRRFADRTFREPYLTISRADYVAHQRETAIELASMKNDEFDAKAFSKRRQDEMSWWNASGRALTMDAFGIWERLFRFQAELNAGK
jgi:hypothetical protein